jgi:hypothetical protein
MNHDLGVSDFRVDAALQCGLRLTAVLTKVCSRTLPAFRLRGRGVF